MVCGEGERGGGEIWEEGSVMEGDGGTLTRF